MADFALKYLTDNLVSQFQNRFGGKHFQHLYTFSECKEENLLFLSDIPRIVLDVIAALEIQAEIHIAAVGGANRPFMVTKILDDDFVIFIDGDKIANLVYITSFICMHPVIYEYITENKSELDYDFSKQSVLEILSSIMRLDLDAVGFEPLQRFKTAYFAAISNITSHELAHIAHGHLDVQNDPAFREINNTKEDSMLTQRTLEMDADCSSTTSVIGVFESKWRFTLENHPNLVTHSNVDKFRVEYTIGIYCSWLFMDLISNGRNPESHLSTYERFRLGQNIMAIVYPDIDLNAVLIPEISRDLLSSAFIAMSGHIKYLRHPMFANVVEFGEFGEIVNAHYTTIFDTPLELKIEQLNGRWARIRPLLVPHVRGGKLAPAAAQPL